MNTRKENTELIRNYAEIIGIVDITPHLNTHLGKVTMLDGDANLIEEVAGDWCIQGTLEQLTDQEFDQIFTAVQKDASKTLASVASR